MMLNQEVDSEFRSGTEISEMHENPAQPSQMVLIHGLRGMAAIVVMIYHFSELTINRKFFESGYLAVDLFFVMSGLVLTRAYLHRFKGGMLKWDFIIRRAVRLYPIILVGAFITGVGVLINHLLDYNPPSLSKSFASILLMSFSIPTPPPISPNSGLLFPLNSVYWSLFLEVIGSIAFAFVITESRLRNLILFCSASAAIVFFLALENGNLDVGATYQTLFAGAFRFSFSFAIGMLIGRIAPTRRMSSYSKTATLLILTAALLFFSPAPEVRWLYDFGVVTLLWPLIVWSASQIDPPQMIQGPFNWSGEVSYALYAIHIPLIGIFVTISFAYFGFGWREQNMLFLIITSIITVIIASACGKYIDYPARMRLMNLIKLKKKVI